MVLGGWPAWFRQFPPVVGGATVIDSCLGHCGTSSEVLHVKLPCEPEKHCRCPVLTPRFHSAHHDEMMRVPSGD